MTELFTNNAVSTLTANLSSGATTCAVANGGLFPSPTVGQFFRLTLTSIVTGASEIAYCTGRSGNVLTIIRAQEATPTSTIGSPLAFLAGDGVANQVTAGMMVNTYQPSLDQQNYVRYGTDSGSANAYAIVLDPAMMSSTKGTIIIFTALHANTATSTITINGGTTYALKANGGDLPYNLILAESVVTAVFDGTQYLVQSSVNAAGTAGVLYIGNEIYQYGVTATTTGNGDIINLNVPYLTDFIVQAGEADASGWWDGTNWQPTIYGTAKNGVSLTDFLIYGIRLIHAGNPTPTGGLAFSWVAIGH